MDSGLIEIDDNHHHANGESSHLNGHNGHALSNGSGSALPSALPSARPPHHPGENFVLVDYSTNFPKLPDAQPAAVAAAAPIKKVSWLRPIIAPSTVAQAAVAAAANERADSSESRLATENVFCPRAFYPWVRGPYNENVDRLTGQFDIKINIPPTTAQDEIIVISGEREGVHRAAAEIKAIVANKQATAKEIHLTLPRAQHQHVLGHQRSGLHEILKATGIVVDMSPEESDSDIVTLRGEMTQFARATEMVFTRAFSIATMQINAPNRLHDSIVTRELNIPPKVQVRLHGGNRRLINDIEEECGDVHIKFPSEKSQSTKVTVHGPAADVDKAVSYLTARAQDKEIDVYEDTVSAQAKHHKFLVGKGDARANKFKEQHDVRVMFSKQEDTEIELEIDSEFHGFFLQRGAALINKIQEQNGGVQISFPPRDSGNTVSIKGSKQCVESATARIGEIVGRLECLPVEIPIEHIRSLVSNRCQKINNIQAKYDVHIQFARKGGNLLYVTGRRADCRSAIDALLERPIRLFLSNAGSKRYFC